MKNSSREAIKAHFDTTELDLRLWAAVKQLEIPQNHKGQPKQEQKDPLLEVIVELLIEMKG